MFRWRKGRDFADLPGAIDRDLVNPTSKLLAIRLNDNPSKYSYIVVRRDTAYFKMPSWEFLMKRGHVLDD